MSLSLLKKSLAIVEEDLPVQKKKVKSKNTNNNSIDEIATSNLNRKRKVNNTNAQYSCKKMPEKLSVEEIKKNAKKINKTEENINKLLKLSKTRKKLDIKIAQKIIERAQTGHYVVPKVEEKEEEKSIFTEEDFKTFEKEYFGT